MNPHRSLIVTVALATLLLPGVARAVCDERISPNTSFPQAKERMACLAQERDAARAEAAALRARPAAGRPDLSLNIFNWSESDEKCKVAASKGLTAAGLKIVEIGKFSVRATDDSVYAAVVCDSPTYIIIVSGPGVSELNALRDRIRSGM